MDASSAFKDSLPTTPETLMERLSDAGISFSRHEHPPLRTVEDSKAFRGEMDDDPIVFALKDTVSRIVFVISGILIVLSAWL